MSKIKEQESENSIDSMLSQDPETVKKNGESLISLSDTLEDIQDMSKNLKETDISLVNMLKLREDKIKDMILNETTSLKNDILTILGNTPSINESADVKDSMIKIISLIRESALAINQNFDSPELYTKINEYNTKNDFINVNVFSKKYLTEVLTKINHKPNKTIGTITKGKLMETITKANNPSVKPSIAPSKAPSEAPTKIPIEKPAKMPKPKALNESIEFISNIKGQNDFSLAGNTWRYVQARYPDGSIRLAAYNVDNKTMISIDDFKRDYLINEMTDSIMNKLNLDVSNRLSNSDNPNARLFNVKSNNI